MATATITMVVMVRRLHTVAFLVFLVLEQYLARTQMLLLSLAVQ